MTNYRSEQPYSRPQVAPLDEFGVNWLSRSNLLYFLSASLLQRSAPQERSVLSNARSLAARGTRQVGLGSLG
jgi:hypothetical protein